MNIKEYIASGVLENYVLGLLSESERQDVERNLLGYPEVQSELNAIEDALCQFSQGNAMPLPEGLKKAALSKIDDLEKTKSAKSNKPSNNLSTWLLTLATVLLGVLGLYLNSQKEAINKELISAQNNFTVLKTDCDEQAQKVIDLENQLAILRDTSNRTIYLKGLADGNAPQAIAAVYNNTTDKKTYLDIINLPNVHSGKQYQLWALVNGNPVDMGVFDLVIEGDSTFIEVPFIENAGAFAVTLEDAGGKPAPDLTQLYVIGNV